MKIALDRKLGNILPKDFGHWNTCIFIYGPLESVRVQNRNIGWDRERFPELEAYAVFVPTKELT